MPENDINFTAAYASVHLASMRGEELVRVHWTAYRRVREAEVNVPRTKSQAYRTLHSFMMATSSSLPASFSTAFASRILSGIFKGCGNRANIQ